MAALPLAWYLHGFTVDDALIPARYAHHLARGLGYRFNAQGPVTDGVTPLGFAHLLAPFAASSVLSAWTASRWIGRALWMLSAAGLGWAVSQVGAVGVTPGVARGAAPGPATPGAAPRVPYAALLLVLCSAPLAAWASAGLETPWVVACATLASVLPARRRTAIWGAASAGLCAWLRPEMLPFAAVLAFARAKGAQGRAARALCLALGVGPWLLAAGIRWMVWGRPAPLALLAKPSDLAHGLAYVVPAVLFAGAPLAALVLSRASWNELASWPRVLWAAAMVHLAVVVLAGGDWMPLARLLCPALPPLIVVSAHWLSIPRARWWALARLASGCAAEVAVVVMRGEAASGVATDRLALIAWARPVLGGGARVATLDVGWVGAATDAEVIDLAGATDAEIAALPGGHTSKAISGAFLTARRPDLLLFAVDPGDLRRARGPGAHTRTPGVSHEPLRYTRVAEQRLAADPFIARSYHPALSSPPELPIAYVAWVRNARASE